MAPAEAPRRFFRPTWAEVDLGLLCSNLRKFRARLSPATRLLFVVKANAYGHGALACAKAAERDRAADWFGVSSVEEGILLREGGIRLPVLILGSLYPFESFLAAAEYGLTPTVSSLGSAQALVKAAERIGRRLGCHLKIETGMGRIGVSPAAALGVVDYLSAQKSIRIEGVYTHLASAESDAAFTKQQLGRFQAALRATAAYFKRAPIRHAANSAAALRFKSSHLDMVRPGLAIYGQVPGFDPILSLKTKVVFLKIVPKGFTVSYGGFFKTRRPSRIATVPIGYADGLARALSNRGFALLKGRRCPIVGRVTMDMLMLDASAVPQASVGDDVTFIGAQDKEQITAGEIARTLGTIPYEVTCAISSRVPRVYRS